MLKSAFMDLRKSALKGSSDPSRKRTRGRPRKQPEGGSSTSEEKRARGREVQHAFQQRRQAEVNRLQQMIADLESTVEGMSNEFLNFGDRIMKVAATPVLLNDIRRTTERFLELAAKAVSEDNYHLTPASPIITKTILPPPTPIPFDFNSLFSSAIPNLNISTTDSTSLSPKPVGDSSVSTTRSGWLSPRLDYGLVHHLWNSNPPNPWDNQWLSYLIGGPNSFASRLYIDSMDLVVSALQDEVAVPGFIPSVLRYRFRHENPDSLMRSIVIQLQRMSIGGHRQVDTGYTDTEIPVSGPLSPNSSNAVLASGIILQDRHGLQPLPKLRGDGSLPIYNPLDYAKINDALENLLVQIVKDIMLEGGTPGDWLDPWSVQQYMNEEWGLGLNARTVIPTVKTLNVLRGHRMVYREHMGDAIRSTQPIHTVQQKTQWSSLDVGKNFSQTAPILSPSYVSSSFPFNTDPLIAQRLAFAANVTLPAPSSSISTTIPPFEPVPISGSTDLRSDSFDLDPSPPSTSIPTHHQHYQAELPSRQTLIYDSGSTPSSFRPKAPSTTAERLPPSSLSSTAPDRPIFLPEVLPATPLVMALILQSVCFGEGPRYSKPIVNETVLNFLEAHLMTRGL